MKDVIWMANTLDVLRNFPAQAKHDLGVELMRVQSGLDPVSYRPMPSIGAGVQEIKVKYQGEYRLIYVAKFEEGIYAISAFQKKSQRTPKRELELAIARYKQLVKDRKS
jgi:phage-related protein